MGGEKLKKPFFVPLLLGVWFLVNIPPISAQDASPADILSVDASSQDENSLSEQTQARDPRAWERSVTFDEGDGEDAAPVTTAAGPSIWAVVRMLFTLALAAAAIYGVVFFIKRRSKPSSASDPFLKILAASHLGSNRYAHIVAVGTKAWLLGSSDGGVNLIGEIEDKDVLNAMLLEDSRKSAETAQGRFPDFMSILRRFGISAESRVPGADDIRKRRERLKGL